MIVLICCLIGFSGGILLTISGENPHSVAEIIMVVDVFYSRGRTAVYYEVRGVRVREG